MQVKLGRKALRAYDKLPLQIKRKTLKQFEFMTKNIYHPSLRVKKMSSINCWEARIDYQYRFTFIIESQTILILSVGPHDEGLGKK